MANSRLDQLTEATELTAADLLLLEQNSTAKKMTWNTFLGKTHAALTGQSGILRVSKRNLLDNSDFRNPVNQRGQASYTGAGYTIDRWKLTNVKSSMTVDGDGVTFSANGGYAYPQQFIAANDGMVGKTFTAAICLKDGSITVTSGVLESLSPTSNALIGKRVAITNGDGAELAMYAATNGNLIFQMHIPDGVSLGLRWVALYEGEYTAETLPEYQPKGYGAELLECQRYYQRFSSGAQTYFVFALGYMQSATSCRFFLPLTVPMRTKPTINSPEAVYLNYGPSSTRVALSSFAVNNMLPNQLFISSVTASEVAVGTVGEVMTTTGTGVVIELTADL